MTCPPDATGTKSEPMHDRHGTDAIYVAFVQDTCAALSGGWMARAQRPPDASSPCGNWGNTRRRRCPAETVDGRVLGAVRDPCVEGTLSQGIRAFEWICFETSTRENTRWVPYRMAVVRLLVRSAVVDCLTLGL